MFKKLQINDLQPIDLYKTPGASTARTYKNLKESLAQELRSFYISPQEKILRKDTIRVFFKPNDLDFYNLNKKNDFLQNNLNKNSTLQEVYLNKKKSEEVFKTVKSKGNIYINDLWSEDYYKKVMKFAHLQEIIDDVKENQRKKNLKKKNELIKKIQLENLNNFKKIENSDFLMEEYLKNHKKSLVKSKKNKPKSLVNENFVQEKCRFLTEIIQDCDKFNKEFQEESKGFYSSERNEEKTKKKSLQGKNKEQLANTLMNFFEIRRKNIGIPSLPSVLKKKTNV